MGILETIWFLIAVLPALIIKEGFGMFVKAMNERDWWDLFLYILLLVLVAALMVLLILGYR